MSQDDTAPLAVEFGGTRGDELRSALAEIQGLKARLTRFELPSSTEEDDIEEREFTDLLQDGCASGEISEALETYVQAFTSLWDRYRREKMKTRARVEVDEAVRVKMLQEFTEKESELTNKSRALELEMEARRQRMDEELAASKQETLMELEEFRKSFDQQMVARDSREKDLVSQVKALSDERSVMEEQLGSARESEHALETSISTLRAENDSLRSKLQTSLQKEQELVAQMEQKAEKTRALLKKHQALKDESSKKDARLAEMQSAMEEAKAQLTMAVVPRIAGLTANQARIEELQTQLENAKVLLDREAMVRLEESQEASAVLDAVTLAKNEAEGKLAALEVVVEQNTARILELSNMNEALRAHLEVEKQRSIGMEAQIRGMEVQATQDIGNLHQKLADLESALASREVQLAEANTRLQAMEGEVRRLHHVESNLQDAQVKLQHASSEENRLGTSLSEITTRLEQVEAARRSLESELIRFQEMASEGSLAHQRVSELESRLSSMEPLELERKTLELRVIELENELSLKAVDDTLLMETGQQLQQAVTRANALEAELASVRSGLIEDTVSKHAPLLVANQARIVDLESQLLTVSTELVTSKEALSDVMHDRDDQMMLLQASRAELEATSQTLSNVMAQTASLDARVLEMGAELASLAGELDLARSSVQLDATSLDEILPLKTRLSELEAESEVLRAKLEETNTVLISKSSRVEQLETELGEERGRLELTALELDELLQERNRLKAELDGAASASGESWQSLKAENESASRNITSLKTQCESLSGQLEATISERNRLIDEVHQLRSSQASQSFNVEADIMRLKDEIELLQASERRLKDVETELETTREALRASNDQQLENARTAEVSGAKEDQPIANQSLMDQPRQPSMGISRLRRASFDELRSSMSAFRGRAASVDDASLPENILLIQARMERDHAVSIQKDLSAVCETLRRRIEQLEAEANARSNSDQTVASEGSPAISLPVAPLGGLNESSPRQAPRRRVSSTIGLTDVIELESQTSATEMAAEERVEDLMKELKRVRTEAASNVKNLQAECEALRRRMEEMDQENRARGKTRDGAKEDRPETITRSASEVEAQRKRGVIPLNVSGALLISEPTPESQSRRHVPMTIPEAEVPKMQDLFDEPVPGATDRERVLEDEPRRMRSESASTVKNLQAECEALHRKVDEMNATHTDDDRKPAGFREVRPSHTRSVSEVEAQRSKTGDTMQPGDVAVEESLVGSTKNPIRASRLITSTPSKTGQKHQNLPRVSSALSRSPVNFDDGEIEGSSPGQHPQGHVDGDDREALKFRITELEHMVASLSASAITLGAPSNEVEPTLMTGTDRELRALEQRITELENELASAQSAAVTSERAVEEMRARIGDRDTSGDSPSRVDLRGDERQMLEDELMRTREEAHTAIFDLQNEVESLRRRVEELETALVEARTKLESSAESLRLRHRVEALEKVEVALRAELRRFQAFDSSKAEATATKDRELEEALAKLQAGNETLDDLRISLQGSSGRARGLGERAMGLVASVERLQAERDAMREQIEAAYGADALGEASELDSAVDAAHAASDDALSAARMIASELNKTTAEDELADALASALSDAQACLAMAVQMKVVSAPSSDDNAKHESEDTIQALSNHSMEGDHVMPAAASLHAEEIQEFAAKEMEMVEGETSAGEGTVEMPVSRSAFTKPSSNNEFFVTRILELEREKMALLERVSRAEAEVEIRKDVFGFVARTWGGSQGQGQQQSDMVTPTKFVLAQQGEARTASLTPWKGPAFRTNWTPSSMSKASNVSSTNASASQNDASTRVDEQVEAEMEVRHGANHNIHWQNPVEEPVGEKDQGDAFENPFAAASRPSRAVPPSRSAAVDIRSNQLPVPSLNSNLSPQPSSINGNSYQQASTVSSGSAYQPPPPPLPPKPVALQQQSNTAEPRPASEIKRTSTTKKDKKQGPTLLAIAFGIGSFHPEWKPDPKELEEYNSDFEEDSSMDARPMMQLPPEQVPSDALPSDPFSARPVSPREDLPTNPFTARQRRVSSVDSHASRATPTAGNQQWGGGFNAPPARTSNLSTSALGGAVQYGGYQDDGTAQWTTDQPDQQQQQQPGFTNQWNGQAEQMQQQFNTDHWGGSKEGIPASLNQDSADFIPQSESWEPQAPDANSADPSGAEAWNSVADTAGEWTAYPPFSTDHPGTHTNEGPKLSTTWSAEPQEASHAVNNSGANQGHGEDLVEYDTGIDEALMAELSQKLLTATKRSEELASELAIEREARLVRESQFEQAESNLASMAREAEGLKSKVASLEFALSEAQQLVQSLSESQQQQHTEPYTYDATINYDASLIGGGPTQFIQTPARSYDAMGYYNGNEGEFIEYNDPNAADQQNYLGPIMDQTQYVSYQGEEGYGEPVPPPPATDGEYRPGDASVLDELVARKEEEFAMIRDDLEARLKEALTTIEELKQRTSDVQKSEITEERTGEKDAEMETLKKLLADREDELAKITRQLSAVIYEFARYKKAGSGKATWPSVLRAGATAFALAALIPTDGVVLNFVNLLQNE